MCIRDSRFVIQLLLELHQGGFDHQRRQLGKSALFEHLLHLAHKIHANALVGLEQHIAGKAIAQHDVRSAEGYVPALDVADEIDPPCLVGFLEQGIGCLLYTSCNPE